jgi:transposase
MVNRRRCIGKRARARFAEPPLQEDHPRWEELDQQLPQDHVARDVAAAVGQLDLSPLFDAYSASGSPATRPDLMLRIVLIELRRGRPHPHQWHRDTQENDALKWAGFGICPSRTAWYDFHSRVGPLVEAWNRQLVEASIAVGITDARQASLDGSTVEANASRHRLINQAVLTGRSTMLDAACAWDEQGAPVADAPRWMAKTPETRKNQRWRYESAHNRLAELHAVNNRQDPCKRRDPDKIVVSTSDPSAALGRDKFHIFRPLYNTQLVCDLNSPLILAYDVFAQPTDAGMLKPMLSKLQAIEGLSLEDLLADAGYVTAHHLALCDRAGITLYGPWQENDFSAKKKKSPANAAQQIGKPQFTWLPDEQQYVCPQGHRLRWIGQQKRRQADGEINVMHSYRCSPEHCRGCPLNVRCTKNPQRGRSVKRSEHESLIEAHRARMATDEAKALYKKRKQTVELGFADIKQHRALRRFPRRGLLHARTQIGLLVLVQNLLTYQRAIASHTTPHETILKCAAATT